MASNRKSSVEPSQHGSSDTVQENNEVFAMTALTINDDDDNDFFEDIGYNQLIADYNAADSDSKDQSEEFSKLVAKYSECRELQRVVRNLSSDLIQTQKQTAAASRRDAQQQKESDEKMEQIRKMEEDTNRIENYIPTHEKRIKQIECENDELKRIITEGPDWTEDQDKERLSLTDAIEHSRSGATEQNARLIDLRFRLTIAEKEVEASIKRRDKSIANLDMLNCKIDNAQEERQAILLRVNDADRSKGVLLEVLRVAKVDLADLKAECDGERKITDDCEQEVKDLRNTHQLCTGEHDALAQSENETLKELNTTLCENNEIETGNSAKRMELQKLSKERESLFKDRAKVSKMRELINTKTGAIDKERSLIQGEADAVNISTTKLEYTDMPLAQKEIEVLKREIKRQEHELDLVNRKVGISKKGSARVADLTKSNNNMILYSNTELSATKKVVDELQKIRGDLVSQESRDEERLKGFFEVLQKKQLSLKSMENSNRLLELAVIKAEEMITGQTCLCEEAREGHNLESKILIGLRDELYLAKAELVALTTQMKSIRDDISRADDLVFREHSHHHDVDAERHSIETDIVSFHDKSSQLDERRHMNESVIVQLGREIDIEYKQRELLRRKYRSIMSEKDIVSAHLVTADVEHHKINETIEAHCTMNKISDSRYRKLQEELAGAKVKSEDLLEEKKDMLVLIEKQREQGEILALLEHDRSKQLDKNSVLAVEIGIPINLHRWRYLQDKAPEEFMMLEKIQNLQRQAIRATDRITTQSCNLEKKKKLLNDLRKGVTSHQSVDFIRSQLSGLKSEFHSLNKDIKLQEMELQKRIDQLEGIKMEILKLEKKRMELKAYNLCNVLFT